VLGLAPFFTLTIDSYDLGPWTECSGVSFEVKTESVEEGGSFLTASRIPVRVTYQTVKLTRVVNRDSARLAAWFAGLAGQLRPTTAEIAVLSPDHAPVAKWSLTGVIPVRYSGPSLTAGATKAATETLELSFSALLDPGSLPAGVGAGGGPDW
jgi:phage tail-like protein